MKSSHHLPPSECPVCGADVPRHAKACPECGADERTGWDEDATRYDGLDLPEDESSSPSPSAPAQRNGLPVHWWWVGVALLALLALGFLARLVSR